MQHKLAYLINEKGAMTADCRVCDKHFEGSVDLSEGCVIEKPVRECKECNGMVSTVVDVRPGPNGGLRRRRECNDCGSRWTTREQRV